MRHARTRRRYWYDYTTPDGEYQIGWASSRSEAKRNARLLGARYRGRWRLDPGGH